MEYIRYVQAEELLKRYSSIKALLDSLKIELQNYYIKGNIERDDDIILNLSLGRKKFDLVPPQKPSTNSDKTGMVAITYKDKSNKEYKDTIKEVKDDYVEVYGLIQKIDIGLKSLNPKRKEIIKKFYAIDVEKMTWNEISKSMSMEKRNLQSERKKGIESIIKISRISIEQFKFVISKLNND